MLARWSSIESLEKNPQMYASRRDHSHVLPLGIEDNHMQLESKCHFFTIDFVTFSATSEPNTMKPAETKAHNCRHNTLIALQTRQNWTMILLRNIPTQMSSPTYTAFARVSLSCTRDTWEIGRTDSIPVLRNTCPGENQDFVRAFSQVPNSSL